MRQQQAQMEREQRGDGAPPASSGGYGIGGMLGAIPTLRNVADGLADAASSVGGLASLSVPNAPRQPS